MLRRRLGVVFLIVVAGVAVGGSAARPASRATAVALPDMRIFVPTDLISIGLDDSGRRELRFTHITSDLGPGPFELDPTYDAKTGVSTFAQSLYRPDGSGGFTRARRVPLATYGTWEPPSDYRFPLTSFTLNALRSDGSVGAVVARSPKVDYCITGDYRLDGIPDTPADTFIPASNCGDPTLPLGWSVGWGDQYDQTDAGQPISLRGIPDGTYVLRATVDPEHVFREKTTVNDVTDTKLRISGDTVTVLSQKLVDLALPQVRLVGVTAGQDVYGSLGLKASVSLPTGRRFRSLQFLLDGKPLGPSLASPPYAYPWTVAAKAGTHHLSARVIDSQGVEGSAPPVRITVLPAPSVRVTRLGWNAGTLHLRLRSVPRGDTAVLLVAGKSHTVVGGRLDVACAKPAQVVLELLRSGKRVARLVLPLDAVPTVQLLNPGKGEVVSGIVPVAAEAVDAVGVNSVSLLLDGKRIGSVKTAPPYRWHWDTRGLGQGSHVLQVRAVNAVGHSASEKLTVEVDNPAPPMTCFVLQHRQSVHGAGPLSTAAFRTVVAGETVLAFVSADGPETGRQTATVSGGGLVWKLVSRANGSPGDAEVWEAIARTATSVSPVTATLTSGGYEESLTVIAMEGADGVGAVAHASGATGAPKLTLKTLSATSLVFAAGNDWDAATPRTLPVGWVLLDQWVNAGTGDTYWSQYTNKPTGGAGSRVTVADTAPTTDHWNLAAVELVNSGD